MQPDSRTSAPEHLFRWLLQVASNPPDHRRGPHARQGWEANLRLVADRMWAEAWTAGGRHGLSIQPACVELVVSKELLAEPPPSLGDAIRAAMREQDEEDHRAT